MKQSAKKRTARMLASALLCIPFAFGVLAGCGQNKDDVGGGDIGGGDIGGGDIGGGDIGGGDIGGGDVGGGDVGGGETQLPTEQTTVADEGAVSGAALSAVANNSAYAANALDKEVTYLLSLDQDRLLYNFRDNAGLDLLGATRYSAAGSWENSLIAGHTMGHYLSALSQAYANAGTTEAQKTRLKGRINYVVNALKECQDASFAEGRTSGAQEGFLWGGNATGHKSDVEFQFNNVEAGRTDINSQAWVPWYTMHKIFAGLLDAYEHAGNETALTVAERLGDWVYARVSKWSEATRRVTLSTEYGGMNDALYRLYALTGEDKYAVAAHKFDEDIPTQGTFGQTSMVDLMYDDDTADYLNGQHANTTIPKVIGLLNGYVQTRGKTIEGVTSGANGRRSPVIYLQAAKNFWEHVVTHMSYVTGGNSQDEHFHKDDSQNRYRDNVNCETCNSYNMLKLSRLLFSVTKDKKYLDYYENTYINAILSSQNPETGMTTYFQPMGSGYYKTYSTPTSDFWCCTGSGMESMSKLDDGIFYDAGNATYVAMYFDAAYETEKVSLTMHADLEQSDVVTIEVTAGETVLRLRRPDWTNKFEVKVGENTIEVPADDDFADLEVKEGMTVTVTLGKHITLHNLPDAENVYAFKYGPFVLSAELGTADMNSGVHGWAGSIEVPNKLAGLKESYNLSAGSLEEFAGNIDTYMTRGENGKFTLTGIEGSPLTYSIHYKQYEQRYAIYFRFIGTGAGPEQGGYEEATVDSIQPGRGQYETTDRMTDAENSQGTDSETSRYALAGGRFSYYMGVDKTKPDENYLMTDFMKADNGKSIRISAGGTVLFAGTLNYTGTDALYERYFHIPSAVVAAAERRTIDTVGRDCILITIESNVAGEASAKVAGEFKIVTRTLKQGGIAYFVDCGDYDPTTVSDGETLGLYQSVTDQVYGADAGTGMQWGIWDEAAADTWRGATPAQDKGIATNSTWAYEFNDADGLDKTASNRYTKNQFEEGWTTLKLGYKFELPNGNYTVKMYFSDPWGCSKNADVAANGTNKLTNAPCEEEVTFTVTVTDGTLTLNITNAVNTGANDLCINLSYIIIALA